MAGTEAVEKPLTASEDETYSVCGRPFSRGRKDPALTEGRSFYLPSLRIGGSCCPRRHGGDATTEPSRLESDLLWTLDLLERGGEACEILVTGTKPFATAVRIGRPARC